MVREGRLELEVEIETLWAESSLWKPDVNDQGRKQRTDFGEQLCAVSYSFIYGPERVQTLSLHPGNVELVCIG